MVERARLAFYTPEALASQTVNGIPEFKSLHARCEKNKKAPELGDPQIGRGSSGAEERRLFE